MHSLYYGTAPGTLIYPCDLNGYIQFKLILMYSIHKLTSLEIHPITFHLELFVYIHCVEPPLCFFLYPFNVQKFFCLGLINFLLCCCFHTWSPSCTNLVSLCSYAVYPSLLPSQISPSLCSAGVGNYPIPRGQIHPFLNDLGVSKPRHKKPVAILWPYR
jgi:hypothetical protein